MKNSRYIGSPEHIRNLDKARVLSSARATVMASQRREEYYKNPVACFFDGCGKPVPFINRIKGKFCSRSCSAKKSSVNRVRSEESNKKVAESLRAFGERNRKRKCRPCLMCKEQFYSRHNKAKFCSRPCVWEFDKKDPNARARKIQRGKKGMEEAMKKGNWKGWSGQGRRVESYPEKFIRELLNKHCEIPYEPQYPVSRFSLDFAFLEQKVALEVDGKQHNYPERAAHDKRRDKKLASLGWIVIRIPWQPKNDCESVKLRFFNFLQTVRQI